MQLILPIVYFSLLSLLIFGLGRLVFYYRYSEKNERKNYRRDILKSYLLGARFDLKSIATVNYFPLILALIIYFMPAYAYSAYYIILVYYSFVLFTFVTLMVTDYFFYSYFNDRINYLIWGLVDDDLKALLTTIWKDYHVLRYLMVIIFILAALFLLLKFVMLSAFMSIPTTFWGFFTIWIAVFIINFMFTRGTLGHMPLSVKHAYVSEHVFLNMLCNNPVTLMYYMIKMRKKNKKNKEFETPLAQNVNKIKAILKDSDCRINDIAALFLKRSPLIEPTLKPPHVVVFMMESFGSQFIIEDPKARDLLGSLKAHFEADHVFYNFISEANGTAESFAALVANMMVLPYSNALTESQYLNKCISSSVAKLYRDQGYETMAAYGGLLSWRNIGKFLESQCFDHVKGQKNIIHELNLNEKEVLGNEWGIFDEYLIQYVLNYLEKATKPQLVFVLSTTNHPPFSTPKHFHIQNNELVKNYQKRFLRSEETAKRFKAYAYCNNALGDFLSSIKTNEKLAAHTLIAITGDHAYRGYKTSDTDSFLKLAVPFYLYTPQSYVQGYSNINYDKFGSHKDVMSTMIDLSLSDCEYYGLGNNMLINDRQGIAFNASGVTANQDGLVVLGAQPTFYAFKGRGGHTHVCAKNKALASLLDQYYASIDATSLFLKEACNHRF